MSPSGWSQEGLLRPGNPQEGVTLPHFLAGRDVLAEHRPETASSLSPWKGREGELLERVTRSTLGEAADLNRGVVDASLEACRIGTALERASAADKIQVPGGLKSLEGDLQRTSARLQAFGHEAPFRADTLKAMAPGTLKAALENVRKGGLLADGPEWTLHKDQAPALAADLNRTLHKQLELDRQVSDPMFGPAQGGR